MSLPLEDTPTLILRSLMITLGLGSDNGAEWPIFVGMEPPRPDQCITLYNSAGMDDGRIQFDGQQIQFPGIQIRVRSRTYSVGYAKASQIRHALSEDAYDNTILLNGRSYRLQACSRIGQVLALGKQNVDGNRISDNDIFTVNCTVWIERDDLGTGS